MSPTAGKEYFVTLVQHLSHGLLEREAEIRLAFIAALAGESVFLHGPPGTAKSLLARRLQNAFDGARAFDYLMGRFSTPEELFGPLSIALLRDQDRYERKPEGYLPDADIVFLDEIWKAGPPIQNALLTALNEKIWRNGTREVALPLKCLVAASNEVCPDLESRAFWDRFLIRLSVEPLNQESSFATLLMNQEDLLEDSVPPAMKIPTSLWAAWQKDIARVELDRRIIHVLHALRTSLSRMEGHVGTSDRRWKKIGHLLRASAFLHGRSVVVAADCALVPWCLWEQPAQIEPLKEQLCRLLASDYYGALDEVRGLGAAVAASNASPHAHAGGPVLVDGEYYLVDGLPREDPDDQILLWRGDWEALGSVPVAAEIFVHRKGRYHHSLDAMAARRPEPWELELDGQKARIRVQAAHSGPGSDPDHSTLESLLGASRALRVKEEEAWKDHMLAGLLPKDLVLASWDALLERAALAL